MIKPYNIPRSFSVEHGLRFKAPEYKEDGSYPFQKGDQVQVVEVRQLKSCRPLLIKERMPLHEPVFPHHYTYLDEVTGRQIEHPVDGLTGFIGYTSLVRVLRSLGVIVLPRKESLCISPHLKHLFFRVVAIPSSYEGSKSEPASRLIYLIWDPTEEQRKQLTDSEKELRRPFCIFDSRICRPEEFNHPWSEVRDEIPSEHLLDQHSLQEGNPTKNIQI